MASVQIAGHRSPLFQFLRVKYVYLPHSSGRQEEKNAKMSAAPFIKVLGVQKSEKIKSNGKQRNFINKGGGTQMAFCNRQIPIPSILSSGSAITDISWLKKCTPRAMSLPKPYKVAKTAG